MFVNIFVAQFAFFGRKCFFSDVEIPFSSAEWEMMTHKQQPHRIKLNFAKEKHTQARRREKKFIEPNFLRSTSEFDIVFFRLFTRFLVLLSPKEWRRKMTSKNSCANLVPRFWFILTCDIEIETIWKAYGLKVNQKVFQFL